MSNYGKDFIRLTPASLADHHDLILSMLAEGCKYTNEEFNERDILGWFFEGEVKLWLTFVDQDPTQVSQITVTKIAGQELNVLMWCGTAHDWDLVWEHINEVAKIEDCKKISIRGRRGFLRRFKKHGAKEKYAIIQMEVK